MSIYASMYTKMKSHGRNLHPKREAWMYQNDPHNLDRRGHLGLGGAGDVLLAGGDLEALIISSKYILYIHIYLFVCSY